MGQLIFRTEEEITKRALEEAVRELGIFVASHFRTPMSINMKIDDLTTMSGDVTFHPSGEKTTVNGYMISDTDWCFQLPDENAYLQQTVYIPFDILETYIDDIETAEADYAVHVVPTQGAVK